MKSLWIAALLTVVVTSVQAEDHWYAPQVGQRHPDVLLPRIDDRAPMSLSQFRGQRVLLIQFASW